MPADFNIAAGVKVPEQGQQANPLAMMGQWAQIQNAMNQNRLFQQEFAAKQRAGQIMATSEDLESGLNSLLTDPLAAPFAGPIISNVRAAQLSMTQMQGEQQKQAENGMQAFAKLVPMIASNPTNETWDNAANSVLATLSPSARNKAIPAIGSLKKALTDGLPDDPQKRAQVYQQRWLGLMAASGVTPDTMKILAGGTPIVVDGGGYKQPGLQTFGGAVVPQGQPWNMTLAPTVTDTPGGNPVIVGGGGGPPGNALMPSGAGTGNPMTAPLAPPSPPSRPAAPVPGNGSRNSAGMPGPSDSGRAAGDGKPLFTGMTAGAGRPTTLGGNVWRDPLELEREKPFQKKYAEDEAAEFEHANIALGQLDQMNAEFDKLAQAGGMLQPGSLGQQRLAIGNFINTMAAAAGMWDPSKPQGKDNKAPFDPAAIGEGEAMVKNTNNLAITALTTLLGTQREAAETITRMTRSVPGIDQTYLGGKLLTASMKAIMQRVVDQREFKTEWMARNHGDLFGSDVAFSKSHPAEDYGRQVLADFGLSPKGFTSPDAVVRAFKNGYIDKETASQQLEKLGGTRKK